MLAYPDFPQPPPAHTCILRRHSLPGVLHSHVTLCSWDRQAYITTVATGKPSFIPAVTEISYNFIVADGDADGGAVDNDDGSSYYDIHHNFAV